MDYKLKAGTLYAAGENTPLASIRTVFGESTNNIFGPAGELVAHTEVRVRGDLNGQEQGVEKKEYVLYDRDQSECAVARRLTAKKMPRMWRAGRCAAHRGLTMRGFVWRAGIVYCRCMMKDITACKRRKAFWWR